MTHEIWQSINIQKTAKRCMDMNKYKMPESNKAATKWFSTKSSVDITIIWHLIKVISPLNHINTG
jgi:hypothetical protein